MLKHCNVTSFFIETFFCAIYFLYSFYKTVKSLLIQVYYCRMTNYDFTILGAGSIGIGTAMHLQQRGFKVQLVDRLLPASATSYGNAGVVNNCSFMPINNPSLIAKLPGLLLNNKPGLRYSIRHVLSNPAWCINFLKSTRAEQTLKTANALATLVSGALDEHKALMQRVGNMNRLSESGWLKVYRHHPDSFFSELENRLFEQHDIKTEILTASDIARLEPALNPVFESGYLLKDSASVNNPGALLKEYVDNFVASGGIFTQAGIQSLARSNDGFQLLTDVPDNDISCKKLIICAGPWSGTLLEQLDFRVLLQVERGYHQHFNISGSDKLHRPIHDVNSGYIMAPMELGVRLTTGVELNHRDAPEQHGQLEQVIPRAREAVSLADPTPDPIWMGCRPTFPDSKPVIDRAPGEEHLWIACGHQHIGLMSGPVTGKLLVQRIVGEVPDIDLQPFNADRWIKRVA